MNSQIDFRTLPMNIPSLCIPRVFSNIDEKRIRRVLDELKLGDIDRVDVISSKPTDKGDKFNRVFIHFARWNTNENATTARERLINGKDIKIIYDEPWFWKVSAYREPSNGHSRSKAEKSGGKKVSIQFDSDDEGVCKTPSTRTQQPTPRRDSKPPARLKRDNSSDNRCHDQVRHYAPRNSDSSPPRRREPVKPAQKEPMINTPVPSPKAQSPSVVPELNQPVDVCMIDYGSIMPPPPKKKFASQKLKIKVETEPQTELEPGEIKE